MEEDCRGEGEPQTTAGKALLLGEELVKLVDDPRSALALPNGLALAGFRFGTRFDNVPPHRRHV